jgi:hypothetical protein
MEAAAVFVAILVALFVAMFLPLVLPGKQWREAEDRERARRIVDAKMSARLLRFNI